MPMFGASRVVAKVRFEANQAAPSPPCEGLESARPGRCRALRRRSLHYALQTSIIRTYALASRLRASWMEARVTKVARVSVRFSKSLTRRRLRPNQEKV